MSPDNYKIDGLVPSKGIFHPNDVAELQTFMSERNSYRESVSIIGGGTRLQFGNQLKSYDYAVNTSLINSMSSHNEADLTCTVQAGMKMQILQDSLKEHGQFLAVDCPFPAESTVGGTLASNSPGFLRWQLAHMRDMVIGMKVVFAAGTLTKSGGQVVKNVSGYDMARLHIGGLGTLGVITEVSFKLTPLPAKEGSITVGFDSRDDAFDFSRKIFNSYAMPLALVVVNGELTKLFDISDSFGKTTVVVRLGGRQKAFERQISIISDISKKFQKVDVDILDTQLSDSTWNKIRDYGWLDPTIETIVNVSSSPVATRTVDETLSKIMDKYEVSYNLVSQPGFGVTYGYFGTVQGEIEKWVHFVKEIKIACAKIGGTIKFEKVPNVGKCEIDVWPEVEPRVLKLMRDLKKTYDPAGILNKGRFIGRI